MRIRNFIHKGLDRLYAQDSAKGLDDMEDPEELRALTARKVRTLTGGRKGTWSLSVTRNRRLTFRIDPRSAKSAM